MEFFLPVLRLLQADKLDLHTLARYLSETAVKGI